MDSVSRNISINGKNHKFTTALRDFNIREIEEPKKFAAQNYFEDKGSKEMDMIVFKDEKGKLFYLESDEIDIKLKLGLPKVGDIISFVDDDDNKFGGEVVESQEYNRDFKQVKMDSLSRNISINGKNHEFTTAVGGFDVIRDADDLGNFSEKQIEEMDIIFFENENGRVFALQSDEIDIKSKFGLPKSGDTISFVDYNNVKFEGKVIDSLNN